MRKLGLIVFVWFALSSLSDAQAQKPARPVMLPKQITGNLQNWQYYESHYLDLSKALKAFNITSSPMSKGRFLKYLMTGRYLPVRLVTTDQSVQYQLYRFDAAAPSGYRTIVKDLAKTEYAHYSKTNQPLPDFSFTDINGHTYNKVNTAGKILVLKTWFIKCSACIQEMPQVNTLAGRYKNRNDILFISLALDPKEKLKAFLANRPFRYATIPEQQHYISDQLHINSYPTHILVNKQGIITFVTEYADQLADALNVEAAK